MTVSEVKQSLGYVNVLWQGKTYVGRISGRLNPFASVAICGRPTRRKATSVCGFYVDSIMGPIFHVAWETVAYCLTANKPVRF